MYTPGKLIFFDPFHFKNNNESAPKFFLVLCIIDGNTILASLPSKQHHLPKDQEINHGCLEIPDSCINCYVFKSRVPITKNGWSFDLDTKLYGQWLEDYNLDILNENYQIEGVDYEIKGELTDEELSNVIKCFANSSSVKRRYKRILSK